MIIHEPDMRGVIDPNTMCCAGVPTAISVPEPMLSVVATPNSTVTPGSIVNVGGSYPIVLMPTPFGARYGTPRLRHVPLTWTPPSRTRIASNAFPVYVPFGMEGTASVRTTSGTLALPRIVKLLDVG